jgi:hypothetical protein
LVTKISHTQNTQRARVHTFKSLHFDLKTIFFLLLLLCFGEWKYSHFQILFRFVDNAVIELEEWRGGDSIAPSSTFRFQAIDNICSRVYDILIEHPAAHA